MKYEVRKEVEFGCTIFSVYNTKTNNRVNLFETIEEAQLFAERQEKNVHQHLSKITTE